ncbi:DUF6516 family protein [Caballeronia sp. LP006]|uniref:toxin-antitoxin system TumE family protein n=1 Tax=unclassified Caballeronia TaxID=2646786 RepID=UPI002027AFAF|nr:MULTISPECIES: DUF6516 family protein [unclassified Caballeronia]MDR5827378.1 DUF6516 family protein [Caballeronia sp. LP006]
MSNTKAVLIEDERLEFAGSGFAEIVLWHVPVRVQGCTHFYKYRFAYVAASTCVLRYDNERGKGDHRHFAGVESPYEFSTPQQLYADFWADVAVWNRWRAR